MAVKSTMETVGVGTRSDQPVKRPLSEGITSATAWAAPVDVGMILQAAALARRLLRHPDMIGRRQESGNAISWFQTGVAGTNATCMI